jgi:2-dehydropantoate 2-reductase
VRVLVFGAGATGSLLGAFLFRSGVEVHLVARRAHSESIRSGGLVVDGLEGSPFRIPSTEAPPDGAQFDRILFTVKAGDIEEGARAIGQSLAGPAPLVALQNGLGIRARCVRAFRASGWAYPEKWVTRGIQLLGATYLSPGHIRRAGEGEEILLGDSGSEGGLNGFDRLFSMAGIGVRVVGSIDREEWRKAIVNAAVNPITADHGVENGRLSEDPLRGQALRLLEEARRVAEAEGVGFSEEEIERDFFRVVRGSARNRSSMLQDLDAGRPTEIDAISGEILRIAERRGLDLPNTRREVERIRARALAGRRPRTTEAGPIGTPDGGKIDPAKSK